MGIVQRLTRTIFTIGPQHTFAGLREKSPYDATKLENLTNKLQEIFKIAAESPPHQNPDSMEYLLNKNVQKQWRRSLRSVKLQVLRAFEKGDFKTSDPTLKEPACTDNPAVANFIKIEEIYNSGIHSIKKYFKDQCVNQQMILSIEVLEYICTTLSFPRLPV
jgi:hypothetical protein